VINVSDFILLPYTRDLTEGGIAYALRTLPYTYNRPGGSPYDRLRHMTAGAAVELAFRRYLTEQQIPFEVTGAAPFTDPQRYDVRLAGRRCDIKTFLISYRRQIVEMKRSPQIMLSAPALVPSEQNAAEGHSDKDIYLFAFLRGLLATSPHAMQKAIAKQLPLYLVHVMPHHWRRPSKWSPLGRLSLKSESAQNQSIEIHGEVEGRERRQVTVELPPKTRIQVSEEFFTIEFIQSKALPDARIGIYSPARQQTHLISPLEWGNIWVYGMDIWLAGWLSRAEFIHKAVPLPAGSRVFQYQKTRAKNLAVPLRELKPIAELLKRTKEWSQ
jgi:hypothetical protein